VKEIADEQGVAPHFVPISLATDNGAMIAWTGILAYTHGVRTEIESSYVDPKWRLDEVEIPWR